jgi:hypothetical protein
MDTITGISLLLHPGHQFRHAVTERVLGLPVQQALRFANVRKAMTDIPWSIFTHDLRSNVFVEGER